MANVRIYTGDRCGYCTMAKRLLDARGIAYIETNVSDDFEQRKWLIETTGQRTVPQIFFGELVVGGYAELTALDRAGTLMATLESNA